MVALVCGVRREGAHAMTENWNNNKEYLIWMWEWVRFEGARSSYRHSKENSASEF